MFKIVRSVTLVLILVALVWVLDHKQDILSSTPLSALPPVGRFIDPYQGFWANAQTDDSDSHIELVLPGITKPIKVVYDIHRIPHIFAANEADLYFAQGYLTAKDRLWQMEFQTLAAAGRISEIIGRKALEYDRYQHRLGMIYGAEKSLDTMMKDPVSRMLLVSYTKGINAWIDGLKPADLPIEYKLLDYKPEHWQPLKCMLLLKSMAATLSAESDAAAMTANRQKFGKQVIDDLFPDYPYQESPIIPAGTPWPFKPVTVQDPATTSVPAAPKPNQGKQQQSASIPGLDFNVHHGRQSEDAAALGSNNWAVAGSRTADGRSLLANDPHLTLSLPSIWYAVQLNAPGINVEGVSLPGAPGVIIGFNDHITWGVTNVGAGVLDIYRMQWKDKSKNEYFFDGAWRHTSKRVYEIKIRGLANFTDTVIFTHQGPVVHEASFTGKGNDAMLPPDMAVRWTAHDGFNELRAFYEINKASDYDQFVKALETYGAPGQNFAFADDKKNIALWVNGKFPLKYKDEGKYILDGSQKLNDWKGFILHQELPHILNPTRGYVSSANQSSTDPSYPYYLNWQFESPYRGLRINTLLEGMKNVSADSLRKMQLDVYNTYAAEVLPTLLSQIAGSKLSQAQQKALTIMQHWHYENLANQAAPAIFDRWSKNLEHDIWDEFENESLMAPNRDRTLKLLLGEPASPWFDIVKTKEKESRADIILLSFKRAVDTLTKNNGPDPALWQWYKVKATSVMHLLNIEAFSHLTVKNGGGAGIISAVTHRTGPSWRMVVEPGANPLAYGVYPGGQSGNPGSFWYDNMVETWASGKSYPLPFWHSASDNTTPTLNTVTISPQ